MKKSFTIETDDKDDWLDSIKLIKILTRGCPETRFTVMDLDKPYEVIKDGPIGINTL